MNHRWKVLLGVIIKQLKDIIHMLIALIAINLSVILWNTRADKRDHIWQFKKTSSASRECIHIVQWQMTYCMQVQCVSAVSATGLFHTLLSPPPSSRHPRPQRSSFPIGCGRCWWTVAHVCYRIAVPVRGCHSHRACEWDHTATSLRQTRVTEWLHQSVHEAAS